MEYDVIPFPSPDEAHDFAADSSFLRGPARDETARRGQDRHAHAAQHAWQTILARVHTATRLRHALQIGDHPLAAATVLQLDDQGIEALAGLDAKVLDVPLLLEDASDLDLQARGRHRHPLVQRLVGVADAGQHVGYWIRKHRYQLDLVMPGITPWCAS